MVHSGVVLHVLQIDVDLHAVHDQSTVHSSTRHAHGERARKVRKSRVGQCTHLQQIAQARARLLEHYLKVLDGFPLIMKLLSCLVYRFSHGVE